MTQERFLSLEKRFQEYHQDKISFEEELIQWLYHKYHLTVDIRDLQYFLSTIKSWHKKSYVNGYLDNQT